LPDGVTARSDGALRVEGRSSDIEGRYTLDVASTHGQASSSVYIVWNRQCKFSLRYFNVN